MSTESVGYRYTRDELAALMLILSVPALPGAAPYTIDKPAYDRAMEELAREGIITPAGEQVFIDRITTLLLKSVDGCGKWLRVRSAGRETLLYRCEALCVLADLPARGACTLTPVREASEALHPLTDALLRHDGPLTISVSGAETEFPDRGAAAGALTAALDNLARNHF